MGNQSSENTPPSGAAFGVGLGADGEDAVVDAHVADLDDVGGAAEGDDGPVFNSPPSIRACPNFRSNPIHRE
jgi:hypothetical protein